MSTSPSFAAVPRNSGATASVANLLRDGTGTLATVFTAGAAGSRVDAVYIKAQGTSTAGQVVLYVYDGVTARAITEIAVPAIVLAAGMPAFEAVWAPPGGIFLPAGYSLKASTYKAEAFTVSAQGGDF